MTKKKVNIVLVLDETGSMSIIKDDVIGGYNQYLGSLKEETKVNYLFTLLKFDSNHQTFVYDAVPVDDVSELTHDTYRPGAATPLYDAIGKGINRLGKKENVLFVIQTDGFENASREFTQRQIFDIITERTERGWQFVFLGAGQDAWVTGHNLGISRGQTVSYDPGQTALVFDMVSKATSGFTADGNVQTETFFEETDIRVK